MSEHDSYVAGAPEKFHPLLERLRGELASALPDSLALASRRELGV